MSVGGRTVPFFEVNRANLCAREIALMALHAYTPQISSKNAVTSESAFTQRRFSNFKSVLALHCVQVLSSEPPCSNRELRNQLGKMFKSLKIPQLPIRSTFLGRHKKESV